MPMGSGNLTGYIKDQDGDLVPNSGIVMKLDGAPCGLVGAGSLYVISATAGNYTLTVSKLGYETLSIPVTILDSMTTEKDLILKFGQTLTVNITPQEAIDAGARWKKDDDTVWRVSGASYRISVGNHTIYFRSITGWVKPDPVPVSIDANVDVIRNRGYHTS